MPISDRNPKTITINNEVALATEYFVYRNKNKRGPAAKNFSQAVEQGLRLLFNRHRTSVARLVKEGAK